MLHYITFPVRVILVAIAALQGKADWFGNSSFPGLFSDNALVLVQLEYGDGVAPAWGPYNCMRDHHELLSLKDLFNVVLGKKVV
jgi:hypothetical protein